jgi:tRNA1(Val) A37 N6-methylase TrmN6
MAGETTLDTLFSGALRLVQPARGHGYRFNVDAPLLAREALALGPVRHAIDLGAGCGAAGLALRHLGGCASLTLVERDPWMARLAAGNATPYPPSEVLACDVARLPAIERAELVLCNPPYTPPEHGPGCPEPRRADARGGALSPFLAAAASLLSPTGLALFIYPSQAFPELWRQALACGLHLRQIRLVHGTPDAPARVALAVLGASPCPLRVEPPWIERDARGAPDRDLTAFLAGSHEAGVKKKDEW